MSRTDSTPPPEDGAIFDVEGYDDRFLRLWPLEEAPEWATEALGPDFKLDNVAYILFVPAHAVTRNTPDEWWGALLCPAQLNCVVKSVDEEGACVLGFV